MLLAEFGFNADELASERKHTFLEKLKAHFGERIIVIRHQKSGVGNILFNSFLPTERAVATTFDLNVNLQIKVTYTSFF